MPPVGLAAWWPLDETVGIGTTTEKVGGNNLTVHGGKAFATGRVANALYLDGVVDADPDYAERSATDALDVGTGDFTLDAWIRIPPNPDGGPAERVIVDKWDRSTPVGYSFSVINGRLQLRLGDGLGPRFTSGQGFTIAADDRWHFVAVSVDRDQPNGIQFYLDGLPWGQTGAPTARQGSASNAAPLLLGATNITTTPGLL